jgi:hypothetical protein
LLLSILILLFSSNYSAYKTFLAWYLYEDLNQGYIGTLQVSTTMLITEAHVTDGDGERVDVTAPANTANDHEECEQDKEKKTNLLMMLSLR